ncbi:MAG: DUF222 domain-containing protein, partial [Acidimicrobiales bacterium]
MVEPVYDHCSSMSRAHAIEQLSALRCATTAEMLSVIAAADAAEDWRVDGCTGMASWLAMTLHVSLPTARTWVRVARALEELPRLRAGFAEGVISWDQIVAVTTFATAEVDEWLAQVVPTLNAAQVEGLARARRIRTPKDAVDAHRERHFRRRRDVQAGGFRYTGFLPDEQAAGLNAVIDRRAEQIGPDPVTGEWEPYDRRCADAVSGMALDDHQADPGPDPHIVVVHVDDEVLSGAVEGNGEIDGIPVAAETARRIACDAAIEHHLDGPDGTTVGVSRTRYTPPRWLRRRINRRDNDTCRFPGCGRRIRHVHHIQHWAHGGPTDSWNLCGLCWEHHHLVHEGGWTINGNADGELTFTNPTG